MLPYNKCDVCGNPIKEGTRFMEVEATAYKTKGDDDDLQIGTGMCGYLICDKHWRLKKFSHILDVIKDVQGEQIDELG
jgi:hypothetical protein